MERLTHRSVYGTAIPQAKEAEITDRLAAYEDAEEQGLLIRLPCKVGDIVFINTRKGATVEEKVDDILMPEFRTVTADGLRGLDFDYDDFGETVFFTREEAEAALKGEVEDV